MAGGPAAWFTVTTTLPSVTEACREAPLFSATVKVTEPGPVWVVADVIVTNGWLVLTVNVQVAAVEAKLVSVLEANPTSIVVCGTVMAQLVLGPVGELLLEQDHARQGSTSAAATFT